MTFPAVFRIIALLLMERLFTPEESFFDSLHDMPRRWPKDFRRFMFLIFACTSVSLLALFLYKIPRIHKVPLLWNIFMGPVSEFCVGTICGAAAWMIRKARPAARGWAIAASLTYILMFLLQFFFPTRNVWWDSHRQLELLVGILGVVCFAWPDKQDDSSTAASINSR